MCNSKIALAAMLLSLASLPAQGQSPPIAVEIKPAQTAANEGEFLSISTELRNTGTETETTRQQACGYNDLWTSDNTSIHLVPSACTKPGFMGMKLKPGEVYQADVQVYAKLAPGVGESEWVTFRLGFKSEFKSQDDPAQSQPVARTLWSNAVTVRVTRAAAE
jgi:hypothetical protein